MAGHTTEQLAEMQRRNDAENEYIKAVEMACCCTSAELYEYTRARMDFFRHCGMKPFFGIRGMQVLAHEKWLAERTF